MVNISTVNYPSKLVGNKNDYSITLTSDYTGDISDLTYKLYLLNNRTTIDALFEYVNPTTNESQTILVSVGISNKFKAGELIYLLDESVGQEIRSDVFIVTQNVNADQIVIDKPYVNIIPTDLTVNNVIGYDKVGSYKDGTATFYLDKDTYDLNINKFSNFDDDSELLEQLYTVTTYSSKVEVGDTLFSDIFYDITLTGNDKPWIRSTMTYNEFLTKTYSVDDTISFSMIKQVIDTPSVGYGYSTVVINDNTYYYLTFTSANHNFLTTNLVYIGDVVTLSTSSLDVNPLKSLNGLNVGVTGVSTTVITTGYLLSTAEKDAIDASTPYISQEAKVYYPGLSRSGTFRVIDVKYDGGKLQLQIDTKGLGKPSADTVYTSGATYTLDFNVTSVSNAGNYIKTDNVVVLDEFSYINARKDYIDYNNLDNYDSYIVDKSIYTNETYTPRVLSMFEEVNLPYPFFSTFPTPGNSWGWNKIGFNDLKFINVVDNIDSDYGGNVYTKATLILYTKELNNWSEEVFYLDINNLDRIRMITLGVSPIQLLSTDFKNVTGDTPLELSDFDNISYYSIQFDMRSTADVNVDTQATERLMFQIIEECSSYDKMRLIYRDNLGSFNGLNFNLANTKTVTVENTSYTADNLVFDDNYKMSYDNVRGGTRLTNKRQITSYQLISDWVQDSNVKMFEDAFRSTEHFLQIDENSNLDALLSVNIVDTTFTEKNSNKDTLYQYIINVEVNNKINIK